MRTAVVVLTVASGSIGQVAAQSVHASSLETLLAGIAGPALVGAVAWGARVLSRRSTLRRRALARVLRDQAVAKRAGAQAEAEAEARRLELEAALLDADAEALDEGADALSDPGTPRAKGRDDVR
jgi:hypothetical protein